tara:strand:- start:43 stop:630 length:588 start_codon:yes stop_codon:yes gene_type:complete
MKFIVGLGNPGLKYNQTRHNVGFDVIDRIARQIAVGESAITKFDSVIIETRIADEKVLLMKPQKFMNKSGQPIQQALTFYKADPTTDLLVIVDDIHLPCGTIRLRPEGNSAGHNGLADIACHLAGGEWSRLRVGVDEPGLIPQADYVLGKFTPEQQDMTEPALSKAAKAASAWIQLGIDETMNQFNETQKSETTR